MSQKKMNNPKINFNYHKPMNFTPNYNYDIFKYKKHNNKINILQFIKNHKNKLAYSFIGTIFCLSFYEALDREKNLIEKYNKLASKINYNTYKYNQLVIYYNKNKNIEEYNRIIIFKYYEQYIKKYNIYMYFSIIYQIFMILFFYIKI
jgi:hypothetical protein